MKCFLLLLNEAEESGAIQTNYLPKKTSDRGSKSKSKKMGAIEEAIDTKLEKAFLTKEGDRGGGSTTVCTRRCRSGWVNNGLHQGVEREGQQLFVPESEGSGG